MFESSSYSAHILRGLIGFGAVALAIWIGQSPGLSAIIVSLLFGGVAIIALRGCPICWTTGLISMTMARLRDPRNGGFTP